MKIYSEREIKELCILLISAALLAVAISFFSGCNPKLPQLKDYETDMYPCYLADKCITVNGYKDANSQECGIAIQKCFRYTDYKRCGDDKDCWEKVGIRY
jgi:hypothetical protein